MNLKRSALISLVTLLVTVVFPTNQVATADDTYERICLTMGWTSCGQFSIYDANGNQLNRVVGPAPMSAFTAYVRCRTANVNLCGDNSVVPLGYAVLDFLYSASTPTPSTTPSATPSATPAPTSTAPTIDNTYQNICLPSGWTSCGQWIIYDNGGAERNKLVGPSSLSALTAIIGCQTSGVNLCMDNKGNPATGYALLSGTYQAGKFTSNSLPIVTRTPSPSPTPYSTSIPKTSDTRTVTSQTDTKTVTSQTAAKTTTPTTQSETRTAAVAVVAAISNVESRTVAASNLLKTYTATEKESLLNVTLNSAKSAVVSVSTDIPNIKMVVTATKTGSKPIVFNIKTNSEGDGQIKTSKNLNGYTVTLSANGIKLDSDKAVKK